MKTFYSTDSKLANFLISRICFQMMKESPLFHKQNRFIRMQKHFNFVFINPPKKTSKPKKELPISRIRIPHKPHIGFSFKKLHNRTNLILIPDHHLFLRSKINRRQLNPIFRLFTFNPHNILLTLPQNTLQNTFLQLFILPTLPTTAFTHTTLFQISLNLV